MCVICERRYCKHHSLLSEYHETLRFTYAHYAMPCFLHQEAQQRAYVEFGAGKGYLGLALAEAAPNLALVLVDRGAFRLPADRCAPCCHANRNARRLALSAQLSEMKSWARLPMSNMSAYDAKR